MAHRSKKKHLKHVHEHEPATPKAKSPAVKAERVAAARKASPRRRTKPADAKSGERRNGATRSARRTVVAQPATARRRSDVAPEEPKQPGLVGRLARTARQRRAEKRATIAGKQPGLVRRIAKRATKKLTAQPRKVIDRAKHRVASRVRSLLGSEAV